MIPLRPCENDECCVANCDAAIESDTLVELLNETMMDAHRQNDAKGMDLIRGLMHRIFPNAHLCPGCYIIMNDIHSWNFETNKPEVKLVCPHCKQELPVS